MITKINLCRLTAYRDLLLEIEPRAVTSQQQADEYLAVIDTLTNHPMSEGRREMVGLLGQLVHDWEQKHEEPITATPQEVVRFLLQENGLPQSALVPEVFANRHHVSAFLAGKRALTYDRAAKLGAYFHLSPGAFYPADRLSREGA